MSRARGRVAGVVGGGAAVAGPGTDVSNAEYLDRVAQSSVNGKAKPRSAPLEAVPVATRDQLVAELNREYAVILLGGRAMVLREGTGPDGKPTFDLMPIESFEAWLRPRRLWVEDKPIPASRVWLNSEARRQYHGLTFDPSGEAGETWYNLWRGFAVEPSERGSCDLFLEHVYENVCGANQALFDWVMGWFAALVQRPTQKLGTALVFLGRQGVGKSIVGDTVGSLLGRHFKEVAQSRYVTGQFNAHLADCLLMKIDEATWGGDHAAAGKLKDLVTGDYHFIEYKGKEPVRLPNYVRLLLTSNEEWAVPAGLEERRFAVLRVGESRMQDREYFGAIHRELADGGRARLLRYLLDFDLSDVPLAEIPQSAALTSQKLQSLSVEQMWWLDILAEGELPGDVLGEGVTPVKHIWQHYLDYHQRMRARSKAKGREQFGDMLREFVDPHVVDRGRFRTLGDGTRPWCYRLPTLELCRRRFAALARDAWSIDSETWRANGG